MTDGYRLDAAHRALLIDVAMGRARADLVLRHARLVNVLTCELQLVDIVIAAGRIAAVTECDAHSWDAVETRDLSGRFVSPGFMDPHVHIEGSLVTVTQFARAVVPRGVTLVAQDPHEIGNVLGMAGIDMMREEAKSVPLRVLLRVPGRIPGYPQELETSTGSVTLGQSLDLLDQPDAVCLAGDYNPQWILRGDPDQLAKIGATVARGLTVSGQPAGIRGRPLSAFVAAGLEDSHVASSVDEIIENLRLGLRTTLVMRQGRRLGREHVRELAERISRDRIDTRYIQLSTDEVYPHDLLRDGHMDNRVRMCIEEGIDPITAYQWATVNVAEGLRIDRDFGSIAPGKAADLIVLDDLERVEIAETLIGGRTWARQGAYEGPQEAGRYDGTDVVEINMGRALEAADFALRAEKQDGVARVRAIITDTPKRQEDVDLPVRGGVVMPNETLSCLAMVACHGTPASIGLAFVGGIHLQRGAIASTVSHDAHNMLVVGANHADMAFAANRLAEMGGGYIAVAEGKVLTELALPVAGLMSRERIDTVAAGLQAFEDTLCDVLGCPRASQILMRFNVLSMANAAACGFSDKGLIDSASMRIISTVITN